MDPASLGLGIYGTIEATLKYGVKLVDACKTYRNAESEIQERMTSVVSIWFRIEKQVEHLREACEDLELEFIRHQDNLLLTLISKLSVAVAKLDSLAHGNKRRRLRYVFIKKSLDGLLLSLDAWQRIFDPGWYLMLDMLKSTPRRIVDDHGSETMQTAKRIQVALLKEDPTGLQNIFRKPLKEEYAQLISIDGSEAKVLRDTRIDSLYIVDPLQYHPIDAVEEFEGDVRTLARKLRAIDPARFSMLQCSAVQRYRSEAGRMSYEFLFRFPENSSGEPRSLTALIASAKRHSLSERLRIAQQLTRAVCYVHALDFVHKNIRPESILAFQQTGTSLGSVYLAGFELFRRDDGATRLKGDSSWKRNFYRHPERQGDHPKKKHHMQHDIYSLGVCLLEIGLWRPLMPLIRSERESAMGAKEPMNSTPLPLEQVKEKLENLANLSLPSAMGDQYRDVVVNCLTCLDVDNDDFADHSVPAGIIYIEKILTVMEEIRI